MWLVCCPILAVKHAKALSLEQSVKPYSIALFSNVRVLNSNISIFMRNGSVGEAEKLFDEMPLRSTVTWNAMIRGYFQNGLLEKALQFYNKMPEYDIFSHNTMISGLMQFGDVDRARELFDCLPYRDVVTWNSMISGYVSSGRVDDAVWVFNEMPVRNVVSWNLIIAGFLGIHELGLAGKLFKDMDVRDVASWTIMMSGYVVAGEIAKARECFDDMPVKDVQAWNTIIGGYVENGRAEIAEGLFHKMPERDLTSWSEMINGLVKNQRICDAMRLFSEMPCKCQRSWNSIVMGLVRNGLIRTAHAVSEKSPFSDVVTWTNMIIGYFDKGEVGDAFKIFELMPIRDTTAWNATIFGLGENDCSEDGLKLFIRMKEGDIPLDEATFTSVLTICSNLPSLYLGKQIHATIIKLGLDCFIPVCNAMITMYSRCGNMDSALLEFKLMSSHDVISWNSIICGFAHHGHGEKALAMFEQMKMADVKPNHITFVGVLSACSHAGLVEQGKFYFNFMERDCSLQPAAEHYTSIVDLLGRFGLINEAMNLLDQMGVDEVPASVWGALFGACRMHKNVEVGEIAGEKILELEPSNSGVYMILSEMYIDCGRREDAVKIMLRMKEKRVKKQPGCSWIEVNNGAHVFLSCDTTHPENCDISCVLDLMYMEIEIEISHTSQYIQEIDGGFYG